MGFGFWGLGFGVWCLGIGGLILGVWGWGAFGGLSFCFGHLKHLLKTLLLVFVCKKLEPCVQVRFKRT